MIEVINLKTCKDFGMKSGDIYIGRKTGRFPESKWGNPFPIGNCIVNGHPENFSRNDCIERYAKYLTNGEIVNVNGKRWYGMVAKNSLLELKSAKRLGCWCTPLNCHGNFLKYLIESRQSTLSE